MADTIITYFQLFTIGFTIGIAGPCYLTCSPVIIACVANRDNTWKKSIFNIITFLTARLCAYLILGFLAGYSSQYLKKMFMPQNIHIINLIIGIVIILLGILVLSGKRMPCMPGKVSKFNSIIILGFMIGISPCAPLLALLFQITLMSGAGWDGLFYALFFGLGTFVSGLILFVPLSGLAVWVPLKILRSEKSMVLFRIVCGLLIILLGLLGLIKY